MSRHRGRRRNRAPAVPEAALLRAGQTSKYGNERVKLDGYTFDSKLEARRYGQLRLLEQQGHIRDLNVHPRFPLTVNGVHVTDYYPDFSYVDAGGNGVVEDVKSAPTKTDTYRLKKRLLLAVFGVEVVELTKDEIGNN